MMKLKHAGIVHCGTNRIGCNVLDYQCCQSMSLFLLAKYTLPVLDSPTINAHKLIVLVYVAFGHLYHFPDYFCAEIFIYIIPQFIEELIA